MEILDFFVVDLSSCLDSVGKLFDSGFPFLESVDVVSFDPFEFAVLGLQNFVLFLDELLKLLSFCFQRLDDVFKTIFHFPNILSVYFGESFLETIQLNLIFPLYFVNLFLQDVYLFVHLSSLFLPFFITLPQLPKQSLNFIVFDANQFPQAVHFDVEEFGLVFL